MHICPDCHRHVLGNSCDFCGNTSKRTAKWSVGAALAAAMMACGGSEPNTTSPDEVEQGEVQPEEQTPEPVEPTPAPEANNGGDGSDNDGAQEPEPPDDVVVAMYGVAP